MPEFIGSVHGIGMGQSSYDDDDAAYDAAVERQLRMSAGEECPECLRHIPIPLREFPLGIATFRCTHCKATWFDLSEDSCEA